MSECCPLCGMHHTLPAVRSFYPEKMGCRTKIVIGEGAIFSSDAPEWPAYDDGETWVHGEIDFECGRD